MIAAMEQRIIFVCLETTEKTKYDLHEVDFVAYIVYVISMTNHEQIGAITDDEYPSRDINCSIKCSSRGNNP